MGIDPGTNYMGYGVLEVCGREVRSVVLGDIDLHRMNDPYEKLRYIFERVGALVDEYRPREVALESPFFAEGAVQWVRTHEMVAQGDGHTVRSVQSPGRTFDREHAADESRDLLLGGRASARDTLFDA